MRPQHSGGPEGPKNLLREEGAQRRGNCLGRTVAAMKPEAQAVPLPGFTTSQGRRGRTGPNGTMVNPAPPQEGSAGMGLDAGQIWPGTTGRNARCSRRGRRVEAWHGIFMARLCGVSVNRSSCCKDGQPSASWTVRICTTCSSKVQRTPAPAQRGGCSIWTSASHAQARHGPEGLPFRRPATKAERVFWFLGWLVGC